MARRAKDEDDLLMDDELTAAFLEEEAPCLEKWLNQNMHGKMQYMENHFDKRLDPTKLVQDSKSVISLLLNYFPQDQQNENSFKLSKYYQTGKSLA